MSSNPNDSIRWKTKDPSRVRPWFEVLDGKYWMRHTLERYPSVKLVTVVSEHEDDGVNFVKIPGKLKLVTLASLKDYAFILASDDIEPAFPLEALSSIRKSEKESTKTIKALFDKAREKNRQEMGEVEYKKHEEVMKKSKMRSVAWEAAMEKRLRLRLEQEKRAAK